MEYKRMLRLLVAAAAALMALTGTSSATELTSPKGTKLGVGAGIKTTSSGATVFDGGVNITCQKMSSEGSITNSGGAGSTIKYSIHWTFSECGSNTIAIVKGGTLEWHSLGNNTGTITSSGLEMTGLTHSFFLGTTHCIWVTNNTDLGEITGSDHSGYTTATLHINALIPTADTDALCDDIQWTATYEIYSPDHVYVDN